MTNIHFISTLEREIKEIKALNINQQQSISISNVRISLSNIDYLHLALPKRTLRTLDFAEAHTGIYKKSNDHVTTTHTGRAIRNGGRSFFTQIA